MSRDSLNERSKAVVGVPFTSRLQRANRTYRPLIEKRWFTLAANSGFGDSVAMTDHIREISTTRLLGKIGRVTTVGMGLIENAIAYLLDGGL